MKLSEIKVGDIFRSNAYGDYKITHITSSLCVGIKFITTLYETDIQASQINNGNVKDKLLPSVHGVGYVGIGGFKPKVKGVLYKGYACWVGMLERCYSEVYLEGKPTYRGCIVCEEWHNFQNFAKWYEDNYPKDGGKYQLDKDIKVDGNKVYSPETCMFVTKSVNSAHAHSRHYTFINPNGVVIQIYNLALYCRENVLSRPAMSEVHRGLRSEYKGWRKYED